MPLIDLNGLGHFKDKENAMIAEDFSASKAYAAGDYCYYNGTLYKFKTAHAAGAWTIADVEAAKLAHDVSDLKTAINGLYSVQETGILPTYGGVYSLVTKEFFSNSGYEYAVFEVDEIDKIYVTTKGYTNTPIAMFYSGTPLNSTTWLGSQGDLTDRQYIDELLIMPAGTKYVAINNRVGGLFDIKKSQPLSNKVKNILARYDGTTLTLQTKYATDSDLILTMGKGGGNNLFDFRSFTEKANDGTTRFSFSNTTDWFMPYRVRAINNADGDLPTNWASQFVGGNHQYNNQGSGSTPTARGVIDAVLFDGEDVSSGAEGFYKKVDVYWTNYIQGQNTKKEDGTGREILMEKYHLTFDGFTFDIDHYFMPLEEVGMLTYYGLGMWWNSQSSSLHCQYLGGNNRIPVLMSAESNCGVKTCLDMYFIDGNDNKIEEILSDVDLGLQEYNDQTYSAFTSGSKAYFNMWNRLTTLQANEKFFHKAKIIFSKKH